MNKNFLFTILFTVGCTSPSKAFDLPLGQATAETMVARNDFEHTISTAGSTLQVNLENTEQTSDYDSITESNDGIFFMTYNYSIIIYITDGQKGSLTYYLQILICPHPPNQISLVNRTEQYNDTEVLVISHVPRKIIPGRIFQFKSGFIHINFREFFSN